MKQTFITLVAVVTFSATGFASNEIKIPLKEKTKEAVGQACCRRGATNVNGENVTVRACVPTTGDAQIDMGKACEKAANAVKAALELL